MLSGLVLGQGLPEEESISVRFFHVFFWGLYFSKLQDIKQWKKELDCAIRVHESTGCGRSDDTDDGKLVDSLLYLVFTIFALLSFCRAQTFGDRESTVHLTVHIVHADRWSIADQCSMESQPVSRQDHRVRQRYPRSLQRWRERALRRENMREWELSIPNLGCNWEFIML